jgi:hypothetical protein
MAALACLGGIVNAAEPAVAAGVVEIDLVFPRNETYAPTRWMPVVFAVRNTELARYLIPSISYSVQNNSGPNRETHRTFRHDLKSTNWSSHEPYFAYQFWPGFATEGRWWLSWTVTWDSCYEGEKPEFGSYFRGLITTNHSDHYVEFAIQNNGQAVDLVAATANEKTCPPELGVVINVTDQIKEVNAAAGWTGPDTCIAITSSTPTPTPNPCLVKINSAVAASMSASFTSQLCNTFSPQCPEDNAAQRLAVVGMACLAVSFGAFGFLLASI